MRWNINQKTCFVAWVIFTISFSFFSGFPRLIFVSGNDYIHTYVNCVRLGKKYAGNLIFITTQRTTIYLHNQCLSKIIVVNFYLQYNRQFCCKSFPIEKFSDLFCVVQQNNSIQIPISIPKKITYNGLQHAFYFVFWGDKEKRC